MFNIVCVLEDSDLAGEIVEVEHELEFTFERDISVYGKRGRLVYPKRCWKRTADVEFNPSVDKCPEDDLQ